MADDELPPPALLDAILCALVRRIDRRGGCGGRVPLASMRAGLSKLPPKACEVAILGSERRGALVMQPGAALADGLPEAADRVLMDASHPRCRADACPVHQRGEHFETLLRREYVRHGALAFLQARGHDRGATCVGWPNHLAFRSPAPGTSRDGALCREGESNALTRPEDRQRPTPPVP